MAAPERALGLLRRRDFRRVYFAIAASELGDAFQYVALMWFALVSGGPLGVMAVRLADSVPALAFGFHGGVAADRWDRKRTMVAADLLRGSILIPIAVLGLTVNAASFFLSAALLAGVHARRSGPLHAAAPRIREGFAALRPLPMLAAGVIAIGVAVTISSGTWIVGVPTLVRDTLHRGAGSFSLVAASYALGSVIAGVVLTRWEVRRKALGSLAAWSLYLPAYALFAFAGSLGMVLGGAVLAGLAQGSAWVLVNSAAQEQVPDHLLGRVMGLISLTHRGAHATGLLFVSPLFAILAPGTVFAAAALALPLVGLLGAAVGLRRERELSPPAGEAPAPATARSPRS